MRRLSDAERTRRFWAKVDRVAEGCWTWRGALNQDGYGIVHHGRMIKAHRLAYELLVGPIPEGMQIDHLCRNRACVNPAHLEPVTSRENTLRGKSPAARNATKTHCPQGHAYTAKNTYVKANGGRDCLACARERMRRKRAAA